MRVDEAVRKAKEMEEEQLTELHIVNGLHPTLPWRYYPKVLRELKAPAHVATFQQNIGLRLTPDGHLFRGADGEPSTYATGHGDLVDALRRSGLLRAFSQGGGQYV